MNVDNLEEGTGSHAAPNGLQGPRTIHNETQREKLNQHRSRRWLTIWKSVQHIRSSQLSFIHRRGGHGSLVLHNASIRAGTVGKYSAFRALTTSTLFSLLLVAFAYGIFHPLFSNYPSMKSDHLWFSIFSTPVDTRTMWDQFNNLVRQESEAIDEILENTSQLSVRATKADMVTIDIIQALRSSNLKSRDLLADTLIDFARGGHTIAEGLQVLDKKVSGVVDRVLTINDYAQRAIDAVPTETPGLLSSLSLWRSNDLDTKQRIADVYAEQMSIQSRALDHLVVQAQIRLADLNKLGEILKVLHEMISREDVTITVAKRELLSRLWTKLGFNRKDLQRFDNDLSLLKFVGKYREEARNQVMGALVKLKGMSAEMKELRQVVGSPEIAGWKIPVEVHMRAIRSGFENLKMIAMDTKEREELDKRNMQAG